MLKDHFKNGGKINDVIENLSKNLEMCKQQLKHIKEIPVSLPTPPSSMTLKAANSSRDSSSKDSDPTAADNPDNPDNPGNRGSVEPEGDVLTDIASLTRLGLQRPERTTVPNLNHPDEPNDVGSESENEKKKVEKVERKNRQLRLTLLETEKILAAALEACESDQTGVGIGESDDEVVGSEESYELVNRAGISDSSEQSLVEETNEKNFDFFHMTCVSLLTQERYKQAHSKQQQNNLSNNSAKSQAQAEESRSEPHHDDKDDPGKKTAQTAADHVSGATENKSSEKLSRDLSASELPQLDTRELFRQALKENIPFYLYNSWLSEQIQRFNQATSAVNMETPMVMMKDYFPLTSEALKQQSQTQAEL